MSDRLRSSVVIVLGFAVAVQVSAQQRYSKLDADRCEGKITRINAFANAPKAKAATAATTGANQMTQLTDNELNAYLRYQLKDQVPVGIVEPTLNALGEGRVSGGAVIDLDAVRKQRQRGWMDPLSYLTGSLPLTASGVLVTQNGVGRFQLEAAAISGISIPKSLVQELLTHYSKSPQNPAGISMDDPFELPARIKEIRVGKGEALVVQ
ncbi:MAG TPA: hypothetical protein VFJ02_22305 [Vicinamibacterales bacterium]|nr:hypothetical protein [Vicinamibacterales bacterium]